MRQLIEEYGGPILAAIVVTILIAILMIVKNPVKDSFQNMITNFFNKVDDQTTKEFKSTDDGKTGSIDMGDYVVRI